LRAGKAHLDDAHIAFCRPVQRVEQDGHVGAIVLDSAEPGAMPFKGPKPATSATMKAPWWA
jgi:hypothetical protein